VSQGPWACITKFPSDGPFAMQRPSRESQNGCLSTRRRVALDRAARARRARAWTVRVSDRTLRHLLSTGYLALESRKAAAYVSFALEAWISDNVTRPDQSPEPALSQPCYFHLLAFQPISNFRKLHTAHGYKCAALDKPPARGHGYPAVDRLKACR
jgi:hypothetical protein